MQPLEAFTSMTSPIGRIFIVERENKISAIFFKDEWTKLKWPAPKPIKKESLLLKRCKKQLQEYFKGLRSDFNLPLSLEGTEFQQRAWKELTKIPYGQTISYGEQARRMKRPRAVRAVGASNGKNRLPIIVPCHRVIASNGKLHGYAGGLHIKERLLRLEQSRALKA